MELPIRILQVFATLNRGGAESMIMNLYRSIDRNKIQFDFVVIESDTEYAYESEAKSLGGRIYRVPDFRILNCFQYKKAWIKLLNEHPEWRIIHGHHITPAAVYMKVAKSQNRITIAHSHSTKGVKSVKSQVKFILRKRMLKYVDYFAACSKSAADWMFGKNNSSVKQIKNAIDIKRYQFNDGIRKTIRVEFSLEDKFVIGHIGNFTVAKNYPFLLEVFRAVKEKNDDARLVLIGNKDNNPKIEELVHQSGLGAYVIFTGTRVDIPELLQMMDIFLFPSLYEGLPVTLLEAQASGLRCIVSDRITTEVKLTDRMEFLSLEDSPQLWGERVLLAGKCKLQDRSIQPVEIAAAGYEVSQTAKDLEEYYLSIITEKNMA